ncbi:hypothetical protein BD770DRAFT_444369 [Pilaira anomala]|nr:hypothetical protein BD770DRAFT_444369 [Pilaira anomala]
MDHTKQFYQSNSNTPNTNRIINTPSPVVFPSASPTPKLYSTPTNKLPEVKPWQQDIGTDNTNIYHNEPIIHHGDDYYQYQNHDYNHFNDREKRPNYPDTPATISPLPMMSESNTLLDDEDISSCRFNEEEFLSSILSSRPISQSSSLMHRRPVSFSSYSPQTTTDQLEETEEKPIVGSPYTHVSNKDPIIERPRRFSITGPIATSKEEVVQVSKANVFSKSLMSKLKRVASGKSSLFK